MRIEPPGDDGLCSVPFGTTKTSPARRLTVRSAPSASRSAMSNWPSMARKNSSVSACNGRREYHRNEVVELSASELATLTGAGGAVRSPRTMTTADLSGEAFGASTGS
jgi:hypothetical protein